MKMRLVLKPELWNAALDGELAEVERLLADGANVHEVDDYYGWTPLFLAARNGQLEVAHVLLEARADIAAKSQAGQTPLHLAAAHGHREMARALLEARADITAKSKLGSTPLHFAAGNGPRTPFRSHAPAEVADVLLEARADITAKNNDGWTPLDFATRIGNGGVVALLEEAKKAASEKAAAAEKMRKVLMFIAAVALLVVLATEAIKIARARGPLHWAAQNGHLAVSRMLVQAGADLTAKNQDGRTALDVAKGAGVVALLREAVAAEKAAAAMATKLHTWLRDSCKIDNSKERDQILDAFVHPRHKVSSMERLVLLEESDLDTILASLPIGTRRLIKRAWATERPAASGYFW